MLTDYTTAATVRALLGVSDVELEDATILLEPSELAVVDAMETLGSTAEALYATVLATPANSRTTLQKRYLSQSSVYVATAVAIRFLPSLRLASPIKLADGEGEHQRIANPFDKLEEGLRANLAELLDRARATLALLDSAAPTFNRTRLVTSAVAGLTSDPVTGA